MKILVGYQPEEYPDVQAFSSLGNCTFHRYDESFLRQHLHEYDMLVTHLEVTITADVLQSAPNCRLIATPTTGTDHLDLDACRRRDITVCSLNDDPAFLEQITSTAELAWLLILASARKLTQVTERVKQQSWRNADLRGWQLHGRTLGIVGYGRLGRMVEGYAHAFGMKTLVTDVRPVVPKHGRFCSLQSLLEHSDIVTLHAKWRAGTKPILDVQAIEHIKPGAIVVNTSRAGLVDAHALVRAVETGKLSGVAIDVAASEYREGRIPDDPIIEASRHDPRFLVTPHIGGATLDAHGMVFSQLARLVALLLGPTVPHESVRVPATRPTPKHSSDQAVATHYRAWFTNHSVERFATKNLGDFFKTETHFLERIGRDIRSVLDIGCASGRFRLLLDHYCHAYQYTGVDLVPAQVEQARQDHPGGEFLLGNGLDLCLGRTFDLVNSTGVLQEEPNWDALIQVMIEHSHLYVLFDVKLSNRSEHLMDITESYVTRDGERLYFVILSAARFFNTLRRLTGIKRAWVFGYETSLNARTMVPKTVGPIASAGVLLERGDPGGHPIEVSIDVPEAILRLTPSRPI